MNEDIERALNGSDADLRAFVASLRAAPQARVRDGFAADVMAAVEAEARRGAFARSLRGLLRPAALFPLAACLVALLAVASIFFRPDKPNEEKSPLIRYLTAAARFCTEGSG